MQSLDLLVSMAPFPPGQSAVAVARDALNHVRRIAPFETAVIFISDASAMELYPLAIEGSDTHTVIQHMRVPLAERLTGWVAAYRSSVWNSDAALDIDPAIRPTDVVLASAIPLVHNDAVVGVLTTYGKRGQDVSMAQRRTLENLAASVSATLWEALQRGPQGIDGRRPEVHNAAISAIESTLSHSDGGVTSTVTIARLRAIANDRSRPEQVSHPPAVQHLVAGLLQSGLRRHCVVLSDETCIIYGVDPDFDLALKRELAELMSAIHMQSYTLESVTVGTSLDLQMAMQRLAEPNEPHRRDRSRPRIH